jgi:hypothetical protein
MYDMKCPYETAFYEQNARDIEKLEQKLLDIDPAHDDYDALCEELNALYAQ